YRLCRCWVSVGPSALRFASSRFASTCASLTSFFFSVIRIFVSNVFLVNSSLAFIICSIFSLRLDASPSIFTLCLPFLVPSGLPKFLSFSSSSLSSILSIADFLGAPLTNIRNPIQAGQELLRRGTRTKWVVIKMGSKGSIMISKSVVSCASSFKTSSIVGAISPQRKWNVWVSGLHRSTKHVSKEESMLRCIDVSVASTRRVKGKSPTHLSLHIHQHYVTYSLSLIHMLQVYHTNTTFTCQPNVNVYSSPS
ncbi:hypothetical protein ZWY2020_039244, partial [Hordeum vulgare]